MKRTIGLLTLALGLLAFASPARPQDPFAQPAAVAKEPAAESKIPEVPPLAVGTPPNAEFIAARENFLKAKEALEKAQNALLNTRRKEIPRSVEATINKDLLELFRNKQSSEEKQKTISIASPNAYVYTLTAAGPNNPQAESLRKWKEAKNEAERNQVKDELQKDLAKQFQANLHKQEIEIAQLEAKVQKLRGQLELRRSKQEEIIDFHMQQLLRDAEGLGWGAEEKTTISLTPDIRYDTGVGTTTTPSSSLRIDASPQTPQDQRGLRIFSAGPAPKAKTAPPAAGTSVPAVPVR
jgi:hypothetical protein